MVERSPACVPLVSRLFYATNWYIRKRAETLLGFFSVATPTEKKKIAVQCPAIFSAWIFTFKWSYLGLNQGLTDYESATLTNWVIGPDKNNTLKFRSTSSVLLRSERDSNSRYPLGVYTLSRRASSTTRASLQWRFEKRYQRIIPICCV